MPVENPNVISGLAPGHVALAGAPAPAPTPAPEPVPAPAGEPSGEKVRKLTSLPTDEIARIRKAEREKGRKAAQSELDAKARGLGYGSHENMIAALERRNAQRAKQGKPQSKQDAKQQGKPQAKLQASAGAQGKPQAKPQSPVRQSSGMSARDVGKLEAERVRLRQQAAQQEKKARLARRENEKLRVEMQLRESALKSGIHDVDYAIHLLKRKYTGMKSADLQSFNESDFFTGLRTVSPHLFGVRSEPATTGTAHQPAPPTPGQINPQHMQQPAPLSHTPKSAKEMTRAEYIAELRKRGISNLAHGSVRN